ncbi:hypothetical protein BH10PLA2_BH10PLA2_16210 [soil metagenome]
MPISELNAPLKVSTDGTAGPYVVVTPEQLGHVVAAFRLDGIEFHVDEDALLSGGTPALAVIDLGGEADVAQAQAVLDRVATDLRVKVKRRRRSPTREDLVVRGPVRALQELTQLLDLDRVADWTRQREIEERFKKSLPPRASGFCFSKHVPAVGRQVAVLLRSRIALDLEELFVSGVVPLEGRDAFSLADHDAVIHDLRDTLIEPAARDLPVRVLVYRVPVGPALEDSLSSDALARLRAFSETANKRILHDLDLKRWDRFIKQAHIDDTVIDSAMLASWLVDEGFQENSRDVLIREYESGRRLLREYDEEQN